MKSLLKALTSALILQWFYGCVSSDGTSKCYTCHDTTTCTEPEVMNCPTGDVSSVCISYQLIMQSTVIQYKGCANLTDDLITSCKKAAGQENHYCSTCDSNLCNDVELTTELTDSSPTGTGTGPGPVKTVPPTSGQHSARCIILLVFLSWSSGQICK